MWACAIRIDLRLPNVQSLKQKRSVLRPHVERLRRLASISVSEVGGHDLWQRATLGVAIAAPDAGSLHAIVERVERYVDGQLDVELLAFDLSYLEDD